MGAPREERAALLSFKDGHLGEPARASGSQGSVDRQHQEEASSREVHVTYGSDNGMQPETSPGQEDGATPEMQPGLSFVR